MGTRTKALLTGVIATVGAVVMLGLVVYPFGYGIVESAVLAASFVLGALYRTVLDDAFASE